MDAPSKNPLTKAPLPPQPAPAQTSAPPPVPASSTPVPFSGSPARTPDSLRPEMNALGGSPARQAEAARDLQRKRGNQFTGAVLQRKCACGACADCDKKRDDHRAIQRQARDSGSTTALMPDHAALEQSGGKPLPLDLRQRMESQFGRKFEGVLVHSDSAAAQAAGAVHARAFTSGNHIYFAQGEYQPDTEPGRELIAHELAHVVQQNTGRASAAGKQIDGGRHDPLEQEADHAAADIARGRSPSVTGSSDGRIHRATAPPNIVKASKKFKIPGEKLGSAEDAAAVLAIYKQRASSGQLRDLHPGRVESTAWPEWNRGRPKETQNALGDLRQQCSPDHVVELQVGGADDVSNLRLLDRDRNSKAGTRIWNEQIRDLKQPGVVVQFDDVEAEPPFTQKDPCIDFDIPNWKGGAFRRKGDQIVKFKAAGSNVSLGITPDGTIIRADRFAISGFELSKIKVDESDGDNVKTGTIDGVISSAVKEFLKVRTQSKIAILITKGEASLDTPNKNLKLLFPFLSEADFSADFDSTGFKGQAKFNPSLPLLKKAEVFLQVEKGAFSGSLKVAGTDVSIPIPGVTITECSIEAALNESAFSAKGVLAFKVSTYADAKLTANADKDGFRADGVVDFHVPGLDKAQGKISYRDKQLTGQISIGKDKFKLPGIKSANLTVDITDTTISGVGEVQLSVPGVKKGTLSFSLDKQGNFAITGAAALSIPGVKESDISLTYADGDLSGIAKLGLDVPGLQGAGATFEVRYAKGLLTGSGEISYKKGKLTGKVHAELTEKHKLTGGGELAYEILPGLVAGVGIEILEDGKTKVSGEIRVPDTINIFPEKAYEKKIFSFGVQIPIFAIPLGTRSVGLVAEIGADIKARAGIGPGQLRGVKAKATIDLSKDENALEFQAAAELFVPAHAELVLAVHGGLGLSLAIASATGGIELAASLGLMGALSTKVQINYQNGIFALDAVAELSAQPSLKFDISAYVKVEVDLFITTIEVYRKDWKLASKEWGSGLKIGVRFPVHYETGKPFNLSLDQLEFIKPEIDIKQAVKDLLPM